MSTYDTCASGQELSSFSSTSPRPLPPAKRMRLSINRIDVTRKGKRKTSFVSPPLAKRFLFAEANSSSSSSQSTPLLLYGSSPDRMLPDLMAPRVLSCSPSSTCSVALQTCCAHSLQHSSSVSDSAAPLPSAPISPSAAPLPLSSPVSPSAVPLPSSSPSPCGSGIYCPSTSRSLSRLPSTSGVSSWKVGTGERISGFLVVPALQPLIRHGHLVHGLLYYRT